MAGGNDNYNHYLIAKYSLIHPYLLIDQWGKPIFNITFSIVAYLLGIKGVIFLNLLLAISTGVLGYHAAKKLGFKYPVFTFVFIVFAPVFFRHTLTSLTEVYGAFLLMLFIFTYLNKRYILAAVIASLLPFIRSEGFILLSIISCYYLIAKHYKQFLFLSAGSLVFTIIGYLGTGNIWWILGDNPYVNAKELAYGSGSFMHYISHFHQILGVPGTILFLIGSIVLIREFLSKKSDKDNLFQLLVLLGGFWAFTLVHSYIWWKGVMGSAGFLRVFVAIIPLAALVANKGLTWLLNSYKVKRLAFILAFTVVITILNVFIVYRFPIKIHKGDAHLLKVANWLKQRDLNEVKKYHMLPVLNLYLNTDPFNNTKFEYLWSLDYNYVPDSAIVIWDAVLAPNEGKVNRKQLEENGFIMIQSFAPDTITDENFFKEVYIYQKLK